MAEKKTEKKTGNTALDAVMSQIRKEFGEMAIMRLGDQEIQEIPVISTGAVSLDMALGVGGLPRGRIVECYGQESSGKTTLSQPNSGEEALTICEQLVKSGALDVVVVDSVAALTPQAEIDGNMGDSHMGLQARLMSQAMRKLTSTIAATKTLLIFTNQVREKIGVMFGNPETTPGGKALKFYASCRLQVQRIGAIKNTAGQVVGNRTRVKVVKNKVAPPFTEAEFDILYTCGISYEGSVLDAALARGIVEKRGSWLSFGDEQLAQGSLATIDYLKANPEVTQKIVELVKTTPVNPALAKKK